jgi:hypothetical protein
MGDGREGRRAEGQKGKMDGTMRRGIVICNAVQDCQDSSSQIESGNGRQKATDPVQIGLTQSAGGGCEPHSCFGLRYQYGFLNRTSYKQCGGPASEVLHKIHERRSLIAMSQETCQYWLSWLPLPEQRVQRHYSTMHGY